MTRATENLHRWFDIHSDKVPTSSTGAGPFPAVLDLYTLGGGLSEKRAALLASRGFVVLALALYGHGDMAKNVTELHLDYFEEALEYLKIQNKVSCQCGVARISSGFYFSDLVDFSSCTEHCDCCERQCFNW